MDEIPLEKILTVSAEAYAQTRCGHLGTYTMKGVYFERFPDGPKYKVPTGTVVVVDLRIVQHNSHSDLTSAFGTALIPKN